ncbi:MAG: hypothetical protein ACI4J7_08140 [Ruminiclostridium sp.]
MKRKGIENLLVSILVFSLLSGCGSSRREQSNDYGDKDENKVSVSDDTTSNESDHGFFTQKTESNYTYEEETTSSTEASEEETVVVDFGGIEDSTNFSDGVAYIRTLSLKNYAIDAKGNILFSLIDGRHNFPEDFDNGTSVWYNNNLTDNNGDTVCYILDKNGNILTSPSKGGYDGFISIIKPTYSSAFLYSSHRAGNYILAYKQEKKFSGDINYFGVMDNYGNWVKPLSSDYKICELIDDISSETLTYLGGTVVFFDKFRERKGYCYDFIEDKIVATIGNYDEPYMILGDAIYCKEKVYSISENKEIYEDVPFYETNIVNLDNAILYANSHTHFDDITNTSLLLGMNGEILMDLSDYQFSDCCKHSKYVDGYLITFIRSDNGDVYLAVFNQSGELAFEPINVYGSDLKYKNGIITIATYNNVWQYDLSGNEINNMDNKHFNNNLIEEFYPDEGLLLVKGDSLHCFFYDLDGNVVIQ